MALDSRYHRSVWLQTAIGLVIAGLLYTAGLRHYLLFHGLAEVFSVVIAAGVFMVAWNSRVSGGTDALVILGIGYVFVGVIDLLHMLSYQGMGVIPAVGDNPTRLWIAGRSLQTLTVVLFAVGIRTGRTISVKWALTGAAVITSALLASIFWWDIFPVCFEEGVGLTPFKRIAEYVLSATLLVALFLIGRAGDRLHESVRRLMMASVGLTAASELAFTFYISAYGLSNMVGHLFKIVAFYLTYRALIADEVQRRANDMLVLRRASQALAESEAGLREANTEKDRFFSILAHDLRNSFGSVLTASALLSERPASGSEASERELLECLRESAQQGMSLLEDLLAWARARTGRLAISPVAFALRDAVCDAIGYVEPRSDTKGVTLRSDVPSTVEVVADRNMIGTVLRNLLSNAVKFTPSGGFVTIGAIGGRSGTEIRVADTGVGMDEQMLSRLFHVDRIPTRPGTLGEEGSGLGLLVCKEFVEMHGGRIEVTSAVGHGTTFAFTIPSREVEPSDQ